MVLFKAIGYDYDSNIRKPKFSQYLPVRSRSRWRLDTRKHKNNEMKPNLLFICEIIILAGGYTPATHQMVGKEQFDLMQENALFVNIARGKMVDEAAMVEAVESKEIYLALDVFETEPLDEKSPLRRNDRVLLTTHRANNSIEFEQRWHCLADEIESFYSGQPPESALTLERANKMSES